MLGKEAGALRQVAAGWGTVTTLLETQTKNVFLNQAVPFMLVTNYGLSG